MNKQRRKEIAALRARLEDIKSEIETLQEAERDAFDNMPESLQASDKGQQSEAAADALSEAVDAIDGAIMAMETAEE
jgi:hypothetical protein